MPVLTFPYRFSVLKSSPSKEYPSASENYESVGAKILRYDGEWIMTHYSESEKEWRAVKITDVKEEGRGGRGT